MEHLTISPEAMEDLAYATGLTIERDPKTERLTLKHKDRVYTAEPERESA